MADYGIKVSLPGTDVNKVPSTVPTIRDNFSLISSAQFSLLKTKARGRVTLLANTNLNIPHGLAYKPIALVFENKAGANQLYLLQNVLLFGVSSRAYIDTTNLTIISNEAVTTSYFYYIFYDAM